MDQERGVRSRIERAGAKVASRLGWVSRRGGGRTPAPAAPLGDEEEALDGWGFKDTRFVVKPDGHVTLTGRRYNISGLDLPKLLPWLSGILQTPLAYDNRNVPHYPPAVPAARRDEAPPHGSRVKRRRSW
ncbi:hypothetical protein WMF37_07095 [Sorangium sp. So ce291]|uniref:hypothetical protein n=1 Tax=Sorangium sp. So ce291 TaxID=3133294 RepID=UPI003F61AB52